VLNCFATCMVSFTAVQLLKGGIFCAGFEYYHLITGRPVIVDTMFSVKQRKTGLVNEGLIGQCVRGVCLVGVDTRKSNDLTARLGLGHSNKEPTVVT
jgi:hypothetical protein